MLSMTVLCYSRHFQALEGMKIGAREPVAHMKLVTSDQLEREGGKNQIQSPSPFLNVGVDNASRILTSSL